MQADLRLCLSHIAHCWKSHVTAHFIIGESFQDYSSIQDFEADFPYKILNQAGYNSFFEKTNDN